MSHLLFLDESGHDHRTMAYEVRGGIALPVGKLWKFIQGMTHLEQSTFGVRLADFGVEIKGHRLLDKDRFRWSRQSDEFEDGLRRKNVVSFLEKSRDGKSPTRSEFTAYGQACLKMARGVFDLLDAFDATILAVVVPRRFPVPETIESKEFLRKDHVFLFERYYHFLERVQGFGLIVMDESEKQEDKTFIRKMEDYFTRSINGRFRANRIVPHPFFVASDLAYPVQAADIVIYCINTGYRVCRGMNESARPEIQTEFENRLQRTQFRGDLENENSQKVVLYGIVYVPDPFEARK